MNISLEIIRLIDEVKNDKTHGASELARQAAEVLKTAAELSQAGSTEQFLTEQKEIGQSLMSTRPAMAPVFNIIRHLLGAVASKATGMDLGSARQLTIAKVDEAVRDSLQAIARIAEHGSQLIADGERIMTHSYSSTVVAVLKEASVKHRDIQVITTRAGPGHSGERTARQLSLYGIPVTFIDDTAVGLYLSSVNKVVVGVDRVCADGKVVNGIGTYPLALAAEKTRLPFYVCGETLKFDPKVRGSEVTLEEKEASEVVEPGRLPPEVRVKNPYFDITPLELVTGIVTENGLLTPDEVIGYLRLLPP